MKKINIFFDGKQKYYDKCLKSGTYYFYDPYSNECLESNKGRRGLE